METTKTVAPTKITATELARNLSDILNRIRYKGETFVVERKGEIIAVLEPSKDARKVRTVGEFARKFGDRTVPEGFADAIEEARKALNMMPELPEWS